ncbi:LANO_0A01178g1_1 [Lachancea nothofagi CBS 11611]|uniref:ATP-dependent RNA helicase n=1 Tax=Lachancea nothofagi CBS 11611 TaxID=1266666 RepID=A0A1G4IMS4_9SACH|nr:LANO_0A01178g1_1 [Lachancea nothofagi CBS 11611]
MFAARFDPTQVQATNEDSSGLKTKLKRVIPLKRSKSSHDESEDENESEADEDGGYQADQTSSYKGGIDSDADVDDSTKPEELQKTIAGEAANELQSSSEAESVEENGDGESRPNSSDQAFGDRHSSVFTRFKQTLSIQEKLKPSDMVESEDEKMDVEHHDLVPIPQPAIVRGTQLSGEVASSESKSAAWLNTQKIQYDNSMVKPFASYEGQLNEKLLTNITTKFSESTFPIQTILLDTILPKLRFAQSVNKKHFPRRVGDILVNASTGSGKTLAYSIPVVQCLSSRTVNRLRCLIVVPTKILIHQVFETLTKLSQGTSLITGISKLENSLRDEHKKFQSQEPDILIITPGRLVDHLQLNTFSLKNLKFLILDEADRLLNQSFQNWCSIIMSRLKTDKGEAPPVSVIKMIFSATLTTNTEKLHDLQLNRPKLFMMDTVKLYHLPKLLQEYNINIPTAKSFAKPLFTLQLVSGLIAEELRILVFVRSNEASIRLATLLNIMLSKDVIRGKNEIQVTSINSNNTKGLNNKLIKQFASAEPGSSQTKILVATDLMSRGIDIDNVTHVINYDLPVSSQQYVHRCGRTARAQAHGTAFNILVGKGEQKFWLDHIDSDLSRDMDGCHTRPYEELDLKIGEETESIYRESLEQLKTEVGSN